MDLAFVLVIHLCVCVCVLEPVFIKTDVSLFTPMPRLDELVSSSKVE